VAAGFSQGSIVRRSMANFFHPSSTLEGVRKVEAPKKSLISVLWRLAVKSDGLFCSSLGKKLVPPKPRNVS
jgi:hypothetical protein